MFIIRMDKTYQDGTHATLYLKTTDRWFMSQFVTESQIQDAKRFPSEEAAQETIRFLETKHQDDGAVFTPVEVAA